MQRPSPRNAPLPALVWLQRNAIRPAIYVVGLVPAAYTLHLGLTEIGRAHV